MRRIAVWSLLLVLAAPARADELFGDPAGLSEAARAVAAAVRADDAAALAILAGRAEPDPWILVEELCRLEDVASARRFAAAVPGQNGTKLGEYVDWRSRHPLPAGAKDVLDAATAALERREHDAALTLSAEPTDGVTGARVSFIHAIALRRLERFSEAAETLIRAAGQARSHGWSAPGPEWLAIAASFQAAGGDLRAAAAVLEMRVELCDTLGDEALRAEALAALGKHLLQTNEYGRAREYIEAALEMRRRDGGVRFLESELDLAWVHLSLGDHERALATQRRVLTEARTMDEPRLLYRALNETGCTLTRMKRRREAHSLTEEALGIAEALGDEPSVATLLANLGGECAGLREFDKALEYCLKAQERLQRVGDHVGVARTLGIRAGVHYAQGDVKKAISLYQQGMVRALRAGSPGMAGWCMWGLAGSYLKSGNPAMATRLYRQLVSQGRRMLRGLSFDEVMRAREQAAGIFAAGYVAARDAGRLDDVCYFLETGRADGLLTVLGGADALRAADIPEELAEEEARLRAAEDAAGREHRSALSLGKRRLVAQKQKDLSRARDALASVVDRIERRRRIAVEELFPDPATAEAMGEELAEEDALLLYGLANERSLVLVVTHEGVRLVDLVGVHEVIAALDALVQASSSLGADPSTAAAKLRALLIEPLELGPEVRRLLVSPYRWLARIPLALLGGDRDICFVPSGTTYAMLSAREDVRGKKVLAIGDPQYAAESGDPGTRTRWGGELVALPATRTEAESVGDVVLLGAEATETAWRRLVARKERWRALHFACHALVDTEDADRSVLAISADEEHDGFISALDIVRLDVAADLVVLSACETGRGRIYRSEGLVGLTRAFMFAGAPRVLCSLWPVDDAATQALMTRFYQLWQSEDAPGAAAALRQAQEHVRTYPDHPEWKHPYYWAAWVLWGLPN